MLSLQLISIFGIIASSITGFIIAYMHRKQMRQIELHKQDPSIDIIPPPSRFTYFVKSEWDTIVGVGSPLIGLIIELTSKNQLTRLSVLFISVSVSLIFLNFILDLLYTIQRNTLSSIQEVATKQKDGFLDTNNSIT